MTPTFTSQASSSFKFRLPLSRHHLLSVYSLIYFIASLLVDRSHTFHCLHTHLSSPSITAIKSPLRYIQHTNSTTESTILKLSFKMCYLVVERYSVCRCLYYQHSVDMCAAYGTQGHGIQERTVLVGYACEKHSTHTKLTKINPRVKTTPTQAITQLVTARIPTHLDNTAGETYCLR
ncbi:hypothetical protein EYC84_010996 [Monilinia fructicola]|uniref:Uncharacterized protein n=1 Tax=Monilinia fructicola TaxID=38448 RepID=A0A5M9J7X2_MONFR|nr:hypothetical protein EYC84_010996 [Monilinia fructicola]